MAYLPPQAEGHTVSTELVTTSRSSSQRVPAAYAVFEIHGRSTARWWGDLAKKVGDLFLRMLKMVSIPLIITSLITGVTGLGQADRLGRMFGRTLLYYVSTSMIAICIGLSLVNLIRPGVREGAPVASPADSSETGGNHWGPCLFEQLENMIPPNPLHAATNGEFLSIIAFSIAFGVFTILVGGRPAQLISRTGRSCVSRDDADDDGDHLPRSGGCFFSDAVGDGRPGLAVFRSLGLYMLTVACALACHAVIVMPMILNWVARRNPLDYVRAMSPALLTAFSSASSNGTLPLTMSCAEERAGISNRVSSFVLPLGATVNMDGTALYEVVAVLFIAQYNGISLDIGQQLIVAFTALLASIGAAGIPHAGLVMMLIILQAVNLPVETQGLIIAVDRVLDMARTAVNVWSDSCGCAVVSRFESGSD